jgi:hypothetical protein
MNQSSCALIAGAAMLGLASASGSAASPYEGHQQGVYLSYANAPADGQPITRVPKLKISFGATPFEIVMDTGSTGILVSAHHIPNIDALPSLGPGKLTYSSSGRIMIGHWVTTPVTIVGGNGASARTAPLPVLAVTRIECTAWARRCTPSNQPRGVAMMGVGFGREHDSQTQGGPDKNPFLRIAHVAAPSHKGEDAVGMRRGYIVTRRGVHIGLTAANTRGDFGYVGLGRMPDGRDWLQAPACISVNDGKPAACGSMLVDTGITTMFLTVPDREASGAVKRGRGRSLTLAAGTRLAISTASADAPQATYSFAVGDGRNPLAPDRITFVRRSGTPFVNTGVHFLNGFDYLFDDEGGRVGFRWTGHVPAQFGGASAGLDAPGSDPDPGPPLTAPKPRLRAPTAADM